MRFLRFAAAVPFLLATGAAQSVPTGFLVDTLVSSGLGAPNDFCWLPDGRILFGNRAGGVVLYANGTLTTIGTVPNVEIGSERALLSIAADPAFATNGHFYVWYSSTSDTFMHLDRFTCTGDLAIPTSSNLAFAAASRRVILANVPDTQFNHNGGSTRFGPDGMLYQSIGDDANSCQAQGLTNQQGVLLRLDVSGLPAGGNLTPPAFTAIGPATNPLGANTDFSRLVIAHGLRNPVRMTIDPNTNNVYIGDVGQNAHEEYSEYVYNPGALQLVNFGWPWREGNFAFSTSCGGTQPPGLVPPLADVPQTQGWLSAMGGPRYRNRGGQFDFGLGYEGMAFYGDYFAGEIRMLARTGGVWGPAPAVPGQPTATNWAQGFTGLVSYDVGPDGGLYVLYHGSTYPSTGGQLRRIRPIGPVDEVLHVSGQGQTGPATEPFPLPLVVQVNDPQHNPRPGVSVNFSLTGSGTLSTTNPVITDSNGQAQTFVTAGTVGGQIRITATTPGGLPSGTTTTFFARKLGLTRAGNFIVLSVSNTTTAVPVQIPMVVLFSAPGIAPLQTTIGPVCTNPFDPMTFVLEDSIGMFGFFSLSGTGAIGNPNLSKLYSFPPGFLVGVTLWVQAVGLDPVTGVWRSNCEIKTL